MTRFSAGGDLHQAVEIPAILVAWCGAPGGVDQRVAQRGKLAEGAVDLPGAGLQQRPVGTEPVRGAKGRRDLVQGEPGPLGKGDEGEPFQHCGVVLPAQAEAAGGGDQAALFVEAQGRRGQSAAPCDRADVEKAHASPEVYLK